MEKLYEIREYKKEESYESKKMLCLYEFRTGFAIGGNYTPISEFDTLEDAEKAALDFPPIIKTFQRRKSADSEDFELVLSITEYTVFERETDREVSLYDYSYEADLGETITLAGRPKFDVDFGGGPSRNGTDGCNYMLCKAINRDGEAVELYAECIEPDINDDDISDYIINGFSVGDIADIDNKSQWFDDERFTLVSYGALRTEILEQAEEKNVDPETLVF